MDFSFPVFLWALPLTAVPLVLHLFFKRKKRTEDFSTLVFFRKEERYFAFRRRLREILLLLLRTLVLLCLVLALARPCFRGKYFIGSGSVDMMIVLDDSLSMQRLTPGGTTAFDEAKKRAETILESLSPKDSAGLILLSGKPGKNLSSRKQELIAFLRNCTVTASSGSLTDSIARASSELDRSGTPNREICLLTDGQKNMLPDRKILCGKNRVLIAVIPGREDNLSVSTSGAGPSLKIPGREVRIPCRVTNSGTRESRTVTAVLKVNGLIRGRKSVTVPGGESRECDFPYTPEKKGRVFGEISIEDAGVPLDNRACFTFPVSGNREILVLWDQTGPDPCWYLKKAVAPLPEHSGTRFRSGGMELLRNVPKGTDLVIVSPGFSADAAAARGAADFVLKGGRMMLLPGREQSTRFSRLFASALGIRDPFQGPKKNLRKGIVLRGKNEDLNSLLQLDLIRWREIQPLEPVSGSAILGETEKSPVILSLKQGKGEVVFLGFGLRRKESSWPELQSFPIVMNCLIRSLTGRDSSTLFLACGEGGKAAEKGPLAWTDNTGKHFSSPDGWYPGTYLPSAAALENGFYDSAVSAPRAEESLLARASDGELRNCFDGKTAFLNADKDLPLTLRELRQGTDGTGWFAWIALLTLLLDFVISTGMPRFSFRKKGGEK